MPLCSNRRNEQGRGKRCRECGLAPFCPLSEVMSHMKFAILLAISLSVAGAVPLSASALNDKPAGRKVGGVEATRMEPMKPIALWPGAAPGDKGDLGEEKDTSDPKEDRNSPN